MARLLLVSLSLCLCWTSAEISYWSDRPKLIMSDEINDGETMKISCTLPIDYTGGTCHLYRGESDKPFKAVTITTSQFICTFYVSSDELLGPLPVGSDVRLKCDYHLRTYISSKSDSSVVTVWGSRPMPGFSVNRRLLSTADSVEVTCTPPVPYVYSCHFYKNKIHVGEGPCTRNLTGSELTEWERPTLLLPVNMSCHYLPSGYLNIRSVESHNIMLFVVDTSRTESPKNCIVSLEDEQLAALTGSSQKFGSGNATVTLQATNSSSELFTCGP